MDSACGRNFECSGLGTRLLDNILWLLQVAGNTPALAAVKPLFLYRMLTRHGRRLQASEDLQIDYSALWHYKKYSIDCDNGKNYKSNVRHLRLFAKLCGIYRTDTQVCLPLCVYGFDHLSNLGEFYRLYVSEPIDIPFAPTMEDILNESLFTCFENGYGSNTVMEDFGISMKELDRFQCSTRHILALEKISKYMNQHLDVLAGKFLGASPEQVRILCGEILEAVALPAAQQPKDLKETALFLAAINSGLMDAAEYYAEYDLVQAGNALTGEKTGSKTP